MSGTKKRKPLVAERRHTSKSGRTTGQSGRTRSGGRGSGGGRKPPRKPQARRTPRRKRNPLVAAITGLFYWIWRIVWPRKGARVWLRNACSS